MILRFFLLFERQGDNMIKKFIAACLLSLSFASAQLVDDPHAYTSGAQEKETPVMNVNHTENDEPLFAVSIHPVSMFILTLFDIPSIYLTIEGNLASHVSLITRPYVIWKDFSDRDEELDVMLFGISEGLRFYFDGGHRGLYLAGHFNYDRVSLEYTYEGDSKKDVDIHVNGFGFGLYVGHKYRSGRFTTSFEVGYVYSRYTGSDKAKDDVDRITSVGSGIDLNYTFGFAS